MIYLMDENSYVKGGFSESQLRLLGAVEKGDY
jgi:hypothetical protein